MSDRRYVQRGVPGGWRIWDRRGRWWWGEVYELQPDELVDELNGDASPERLSELQRRFQTSKR